MVGHPIAGRSFFCALGLGLTAAFFLLRAINVYGDPVRWSTQKSAAFTVLSAVAAVPSDDARPRNAFPVGCRRQDTAVAATGTGLRRVADVLLSVTHTAPSSTRGHRMLCALRTGALDVRVADSRAVSDHTSARMGILSADRLSGPGFRCGRALSALPLVSILEAAPQRCLAQLFLNSDDRLRDSPLKRVGADALLHLAARSAAVLRRSVATFALTPDEGVRGW
jgi:hypothetical protein